MSDNPWLKLWVEIIGDTKLRRLPPAERWCWIGVLCLAGECGADGQLTIAGDPLSDLEIADCCGVDIETWSCARSHFLKSDMLLDDPGGLVVIHWRERQGPRDRTSAERKRRYRERHAEARTGTQEERVPERQEDRRQKTDDRRQKTDDRRETRDDDHHDMSDETLAADDAMLSSLSSFPFRSDPCRVLDTYRTQITWRFGSVDPDVESLLPDMAAKGTPDVVVDALALAESKGKGAPYALGILANWQAGGRGGNGKTGQ